MRIRISLPENRDYAGRLEVLDASGAVVFGPVPAAGRAHDALAKAHGNASRNPLRLYGDTPLGTFAVRGVVEPGAATGPEDEALGVHGVVLLEPASGPAALADAHGRLRLFIQGGGDDDAGLRATAGGVRLRDRDQKNLVSLVRRAKGRVLCEVVTTGEHGPIVSLAQPPLDRDPPAVPGRSYVATRAPEAKAAGYAPRMFVMPERSGAGGGTAYGGGGGGDTGGGLGGTGGGGIDNGTGGGGPTDTGVGPLPITGVDTAPTPGVDINPPPDDTGTTVDQSGGSQLLSTASPTGFSNPYSGDQGGWAVGSPADTQGNPTAIDTSNYTGTLQTDGTNPNPFTGGNNVDPYSGSGILLAQNGPVASPDVAQGSAQGSAGGSQPTATDVQTSAAAPYGAPPSDQSVNTTTLIGLQPVDEAQINGLTWLHYQVSIDGVAYDAYANDKYYPDQAFLVAAGAAPTGTGPSTGTGSATTPTDGASQMPSTTSSTPSPSAPPLSVPTTGTTATSNPLGPSDPTQQGTPFDSFSPNPTGPAAMPGALANPLGYLPTYETGPGVPAYSRNFPSYNIGRNQWQGYLGETSFEANSPGGGANLIDLNLQPWTNARGGAGRIGFFPVFDYFDPQSRQPTSVFTSSQADQAVRIAQNVAKFRVMMGADYPQRLNTAAANLGMTPQDAAANAKLVVNEDDVDATREAVRQNVRDNPGDYQPGTNPDDAAAQVDSTGQTTESYQNQRASRAGLSNVSEAEINRLMSPEALMVETRGWGGALGRSAYGGAGSGAAFATAVDLYQIWSNPDAHPDAGRELVTTAGLGAASGGTGAALETTFNAQWSRSMLSAAADGEIVGGLAPSLGRGLGGAAAGGPAAAVFTVGQMYFSDQQYTTEDYEAKGTRSFVSGTLSGALAAGGVVALGLSEVPIVGTAAGFVIGFLGYMIIDSLIGDDVESAVRGQPEQLGDYEAPDPGGFFTG